MKNQDITAKKERVLSFVKSGRLHDALKSLRSFSETLMTWDITDEINRVEQSYRYMLEYAMKGAQDPSRKAVYDDIVESIYKLLDRLVRHGGIPETPTLYFNTLRYERTGGQDRSLSSMIDDYSRMSDKSSLLNLVADGFNESSSQRAERESLEKQIFNRLWVTFPMSASDEEAVSKVIASDSLPAYFKRLLLSALLLGGLEYYDERRLLLLMDAYDCDDNTLSSEALIGVLLIMFQYRKRRLGKRVVNRLESLKERKGWQDDLKMAFLELVRTRDTERITTKMRDEVVSKIMTLHPDIYKKINDRAELIDISDIEENPEWQDLLEKSGIADRMKELSEIQQEGGDVFMATFAQLKSFPFFSDISNWFLPFHSDHSAVIASGKSFAPICEVIAAAPFFCNSDKYSFVLSMQSVPESQRSMMLSQLNMQNVNMAEIQNASLSLNSSARKNIMNKYVQDLYRFFRLFRRKSEFNDPFAHELNLVTIPLLASEFKDVDTLTVIAEFYFKHHYYPEALDLFLVIEELSIPSPQLYQKIGYCYQKQGDVKNALKYYEQAELLNADSAWTLRKIAQCYRLLDNQDKALEYLLRLDSLQPDNVSTLIAIGHCLAGLERYDEASRYYFKAGFLDEKSTRTWRPLAWCRFMMKDFEQAHSYYDKVLGNAPNADDYLNLGHLSLAEGEMRKALNFYRLCIENGSDTIDSFIEKLYKDKPYLSRVGIDTSLLPLVIDSLLYSSDD